MELWNKAKKVATDAGTAVENAWGKVSGRVVTEQVEKFHAAMEEVFSAVVTRVVMLEQRSERVSNEVAQLREQVRRLRALTLLGLAVAAIAAGIAVTLLVARG